MRGRVVRISKILPVAVSEDRKVKAHFKYKPIFFDISFVAKPEKKQNQINNETFLAEKFHILEVFLGRT